MLLFSKCLEMTIVLLTSAWSMIDGARPYGRSTGLPFVALGSLAMHASVVIAGALAPATDPAQDSLRETSPGQPGELRTWTDITGKYQTEAALLDLSEGTVTLRKADGQIVRLPIEKLSTRDRGYATEHSGSGKGQAEPPEEAAENREAGQLDSPPKDEEMKEDTGGDVSRQPEPAELEGDPLPPGDASTAAEESGRAGSSWWVLSLGIASLVLCLGGGLSFLVGGLMLLKGRKGAKARQPAFIMPGEGVGALTLGMDERAVVRALGRPDEISVYDEGKTRFLNYYGEGISVRLGSGRVTTLFLYSGRIGGYEKGKYQRFRGALRNGVGFDSTYEEVIEAHGPPQSEGELSHAPVPSKWIVYHQGIGFDFIAKTGEIINISVKQKKT